MTEEKEKLCLGFFNEQKEKWECEDWTLRRNETEGIGMFLCGKTNHFTSFAILFSGGRNDGDESSGYGYFTGDWKGDVGVSAFFALVLLMIGAIIIAVAVIRKARQPPPAPRRIRGDLIPLSQQIQIR